MNARSLAGHITALTVVLIGALIGCGVAPTPAPLPDPEGNGDSILSQMPTAPLLESVSMPFTRVGTRADTPAEIKLSFAKGMNRESVESAVNLYPAEIKRNDGTPKRLQVKAICDGGWQIRNPNSSSVSFNWSISKSVERGEGMVAANGEQLLYTTRGLKQLRLSVNGVLQTRVLSVSSACVKTLEFAWAEDNKSVTVKPLKPMASDAITVALSTAAFSSDGVRMVEPSSETLVPEQVIRANQAIALQFSQSVNKVTLESSLKIYQGKFDSYDALEPSAPRVINTCDGSYTVKNPNTQPLSFTWNIEGSSEKGAGNVAALSETKVMPSSNARAIKVFTDKGINVTRSLEESASCKISFSSVWDASSSGVKLSASSGWKLGSYTVLGSAVNDAGAKIARDRLAVVHVVQDDTNGGGGGGDAPLEGESYPELEPLQAELATDGFSPIASSADASVFEATRVQDDDSVVFSWNFGDGNTATGQIVEHRYEQPGRYQLSLTARRTNASGVLESDTVTQQVTSYAPLHELLRDIRLTNGNEAVDIDLGTPVTGFKYEWTATDKNGQTRAKIDGTRFQQRYPQLGTYQLNLRILDQRADLSGTRSTRADPTDPNQVVTDDYLAEQEENSVALADNAWFTRWELKPTLTLRSYRSELTEGQNTYFGNSYDTRALFGNIGTRFSFDARESQLPIAPSGKQPQYEFRACRINSSAAAGDIGIATNKWT